MASKTLTATVKINTSNAEKSLQKLADKVNALNKAFDKASTGNQKMEQSINRKAAAENRFANQVNKSNRGLSQQSSLMSDIVGKVRRLASAYLGVMGAKAMLTASDTITGAENKLNYVNDGDIAATQEQLDKMYDASQKARTSYTEMMSNVGKSMMLASSAFKDNVDNAIRFQEIMGKAYAISGASQAEQASSMYQMIQALNSGVLQGDELRSVREGATMAYQEIEKYAQALYNTKDSLKQMGSEGLITSDIVVAAITNAGDRIDEVFNNTAMTFGQAWTMIKNTALQVFKPILQQMNAFLNSDTGRAAIQGVTDAIVTLGQVVSVVWGIAEGFMTWWTNNWYWLKYVIIGVILTIVFYMAWMAVMAVVAWVTSLTPVFWIIVVIAILITWIVAVANTTKNACEFIYVVCLALGMGILMILAIVALIYLTTGITIMSTTMMVVLFIVGIVLIVVAAIAAAGEQICGGILMAVSIVWNIFVALLTLIISNIVIPIATAWETFANFFANMFRDPVANIIYTFQHLADAVLGILENIAKAIDSIFGSNLAGAVNGWRSGLADKADALVKKYGNGQYKQEVDIVSKLNNMIGKGVDKFTWDSKDAYNTGAKFGKGIQTKINNFGSNIADMFNTNKIKKPGTSPSGGLNLDDFSGKTGTGNADPNKKAKKGSNPAKKIGKNTGKTADNTGKMADSMKLTEEDLKYLKDIADREWKKEFTTANITVKMSNNNTIQGENDLDGLVTKLTDKLYEELDAVANGVYV